MPKIKFVMPNGDVKEEVAVDGETVMEIAKKAGIEEIFAECGGSLSCATCHVYVADAWINELPAVDEAEQDLLEGVPELRAGSRLSCQIVMSAALDGIEIEVPDAQF